MSRQNIALIIVGLVLTVLTLMHEEKNLKFFGKSVHIPFVDEIEREAYDFRVALSRRKAPDDRVIIIDIDERSLQKYGQWPWPRRVIAELVTQSFDAFGIQTVGFDVVFAEPEQSIDLTRLAALIDQGLINKETDLSELSGDRDFRNAIEGRSVVLGYVFEEHRPDFDEVSSIGKLPPPALEFSTYEPELLLQETAAPDADRYTANAPSVQGDYQSAGFFSLLGMTDDDGIIRRVGLLNRHQDQLYTGLALQTFLEFMGDPGQPILRDEEPNEIYGLEDIKFFDDTSVTMDWQASVFVPYADVDGIYRYVPAWEIIEGVYEQDIRGTIALVGTSAPGLIDLRNTPLAASFPGVEVHANVITGLLDKSFRVKPVWADAVNVLQILVIGLFFTITLPFWALKRELVFVTGAVILLVGGNWYAWQEMQFIVPIAPTLLLMAIIFVINFTVDFYDEVRARRKTQKLFGLYVPPEVVEDISQEEDAFSLKPEKRDMTVLFTDIRGFTTLSESMEPDELSVWMNEFLTPMTAVIHKHKGAIDKYMGDAVMAFWGAPLPDDNHANHGVAAALEMLETVKELNKSFEERGLPIANIGIGVNSGAMSVGNMGSEFRMAYTVLGDAVNLGARLESATKNYDTNLIVSEFVVERADEFDFHQLDRVQVKGKTEKVSIFEVKGAKQAT